MKVNTENVKVKLVNGKEVKLDTLQKVRDLVMRKIAQLSKYRAYTLKGMSDPREWKYLDNGTRRIMGDCLSHLAAMQQVPMICLGKNSSNSLIYQVI